ncbi:CopD family protein [Trinickia sp. LjRoot230]|uniref:CopD family protein n=1 Tax=Trinickia sp. LjRoot230 TaxID=3342288 RepID=UPI003ED15968
MNVDGLLVGQVALGALMNVAFAFVVGSALFERWLAVDGARVPNAPSHLAWQRARSSLIAAAFALVLADGGWLFYEAASISGAGLAGALPALPDVIGSTHVGHAWSVAFGGAALLLVSALLYGGGRLGQCFVGLAALICAAGMASLGHAADAGVVSLAYQTQIVHALFTAVWSGIVLAGAFVVLPALDTSITRGALIRLAERISSVSLLAFCVVVLTGVVEAGHGLHGDVGALRSSTWGHVLTLKLALVLLAVVLGGLNRTSVLPRLRRTASTVDAYTFKNMLHLEAFVMVGVFLVAAVLVQSPPP